ncbi:AAA family ATPase [Shewanella sp.]|uniref:AAA family ATPase n=1 Tax=Shewanella sp. TaxID=50422 RepID=UPI0040538373
MLIEFSVTNFKSIKNQQTLTLAKTKSDELSLSNTFSTKDLDLLRSAVIYGANAAGKSNFIKALVDMKHIIMNSGKLNLGDELPFSPYRLSADTIEMPTEFEVTFIASDKVRYQYGFSVTSKRIHDEWLYAYPKGRPQRWFTRYYDKESNSYEWDMGPALTGEKAIWQRSTKENSLFLSTAVQLNSSQLLPVFSWFKTYLKLSTNGDWGPSLTTQLCIEKSKDQILSIIQAADLDIVDLHIETKAFDPNDIPADLPSEFRNVLVDRLKDEVISEVFTLKKSEEGELITLFLDNDESDGTRKLYSLAGPWVRSLTEGHILFIDELHLNLHPKLVEFLVKMFHNPDLNKKNAQLIFTTHDTTILNQEVFRRDQVWFCEKENGFSTKLYPLTDFKPRKGRDNLEKSYLEGKYGAIPFLQHINEF